MNNSIMAGLGHSPKDVMDYFLNPGGFFFGHSNCRVHTLLGSCIAITLWHPQAHIGGMCHFVLPGHQDAFKNNNCKGRYAEDAMSLFEQEIHAHGTQLKDYTAKIFGGSNMLRSLQKEKPILIGTKNIEEAIQILEYRKIPILVNHTGNNGHRRIVFDIQSGEVWVKYVPV